MGLGLGVGSLGLCWGHFDIIMDGNDRRWKTRGNPEVIIYSIKKKITI